MCLVSYVLHILTTIGPALRTLTLHLFHLFLPNLLLSTHHPFTVPFPHFESSHLHLPPPSLAISGESRGGGGSLPARTNGGGYVW